MKKQLYRAAAATVLGLSLTTGMVAADNNAGTISHTGPGSSNHISSSGTTKTTVKNDNDLSVHNFNGQGAFTGDATSHWNTTGGNATSGDASNHNSLTASATVKNSSVMPTTSDSSSSGATGNISYTGPGSSNSVKSTQSTTTTVTNDNDIHVDNANLQFASSGDASVHANTTGGSATSGSASNTNSSSFTLNVSN